MSDSEIRLQQELTDSRLLHEISIELIREHTIDALYGKIIVAAARLMRSECASMQTVHAEGGRAAEFHLLGHSGFPLEVAERWKRVRVDSSTSCGNAFLAGRRVVVPDVEACDFIVRGRDLQTYRTAGIRAIQTTPLHSRAGALVGMISTHWREPHEPSERELRLLDILARQAADLIERTRVEEALRRSDDRQAFLLKLSDALRPLNDANQIQCAAARVLGEHLDVNWAFYFEIEPGGEYGLVRQDHARGGAPSLAGRYRLDDTPTATTLYGLRAHWQFQTSRAVNC